MLDKNQADEKITKLTDIVFGKKDKQGTSTKNVLPYVIEEFGEEKSTNDCVWEDREEAEATVQINHKMTRKLFAKKEKVLNGKAYKERLVEQFYEDKKVPSWADPNKAQKKKANNNNDLELFRDKPGQITSRGAYHKANLTDVKFVTNTVLTNPAAEKHPLVSSRFNTKHNNLIVTANTNTFTVFDVNNEKNKNYIAKCVNTNSFKITCCDFCNDDTVVVTGRKPNLMFYNVVKDELILAPKMHDRHETRFDALYRPINVNSAGDNLLVLRGERNSVILYDVRLMRAVLSMSMKGTFVSGQFSYDSNFFYSVGDACKLHQFDLRTGQCVAAFHDETLVKGSAVAVSNDSKYFAIGTTTGIVNLYEGGDQSIINNLQKIKSFDNLTTMVNAVRFDSFNNFFMSSKNLENSFRMVNNFGGEFSVSNFQMRNVKKVCDMDVFLGDTQNETRLLLGSSDGTAKVYTCIRKK